MAILAPVTASAIVSRPEPNALWVRSDNGWLQESFDRLMRTPSLPFKVGQRIPTQDFTAEVLEVTQDGRPLTMLFRFAKDLDDPSLRWVGFRGREIVSWTPPRVGQQERLATDLWRLLMSMTRGNEQEGADR